MLVAVMASWLQLMVGSTACTQDKQQHTQVQMNSQAGHQGKPGRGRIALQLGQNK